MSKHNYTKYSSDAAAALANTVEEVEASVSDMPVLETIISTADAVVKTDAVLETVISTADAVVKTDAVDTIIIAETVDGTVVNCAKLNVRANPSITAEIVCVLTAGSEIEINISKSTDEWFNVYTAAGVEGYCMRKFVNANL
jgi:hypothetical protein